MIVTTVNISYSADHLKGPAPYNSIDPKLHEEWLSRAIDFYQEEAGWPVIVSASRVPDHLPGAYWCLRNGLMVASQMGAKYLIHTAEDILPARGVLGWIHGRLGQGFDFVGWPCGPYREYLVTAFFGCRVAALLSLLGDASPDLGGNFERWLAKSLAGKHCYVERSYHLDRQDDSTVLVHDDDGCSAPLGYPYLHTHDYNQWQRWLEAREAED